MSITIALTKGRLEKKTAALLAASGIDITALEQKDPREAATLFSEHIRASFTAFIKSCAEDKS